MGLRLNCRSLETACTSLATAIGSTTGDLLRAILEYDESRFSDHRVDPRRMPREVLETLGTATELIHFDECAVFHGTRAINPESFRLRGILTLDEVLDEIWEMLHGLAGADIGDTEWAELRQSVERGDLDTQSAWLYRFKAAGGGTSVEQNRGPFAMVVREFFLRPTETGSYDYLGCPEIVQDICECVHDTTGINLEARFQKASSPCVVEFRDLVQPGAVEAALWYVFSIFREGELTLNARMGYDRGGRSVPPADILGVEVVGQP
jgi:hypothetical protein